MDAIKQTYTISELSLIKGSLFRGSLTDHSPLHKWGTGTEFSSCTNFTSIFIVQEKMPKWAGILKAIG